MTRTRIYLLSFAIQLVLAPLLVHDWDGFVFVRTVQDFLGHHSPYAIAEADPAYIHLSTTWPPLNTWYAYPPLPLLLMTPSVGLALRIGTPWVVRLGLKLPMIAGMFALAWVGQRLMRVAGNTDGAARWERLVLLNPFLIFVTAAWGMFDVWMVTLLVLALLLADRGRMRWAGAAFGASALMKLFPLFAAPAFLFWIARRSRTDAMRFVIAAVATFTAFSLPFFVPHPRGYMLQVWQMHVARHAQGLSLVSLASDFASVTHWTRAEPTLHALAALTVGVTLAVTIVTTVVASRARTVAAFSRALLGLFLGVLFTSKVLNEQYFVIPVVLYALVACTSGRRFAFVGYRAFTVGALAASLLLGWHVFTFWPPDVARPLFGRQPHVIVAACVALTGLRPPTFALVTSVVSFLVLLPAFVLGTRLIVAQVRAGTRLLVALSRRVAPRFAPALLAVGLIATLLGPLAGLARGQPKVPPLDSAHRRVGAFYYLWWANPTHDPAKANGNWRDGPSETPAEGFYTITAAKLRDDFARARANGIDLMVTSFHAYDVPLLPTVLNAASSQDIVVAPLIELDEVYTRPEYGSAREGFTLSEQTESAIVDLTSKALGVFSDAPAAYRPDGKLAVFLYDAYYAGADWRPPFTTVLTDRVVTLAIADAGGDEKLAPPRNELERSRPSTFLGIFDESPHGHLWRRAYAQLYQEFWARVRKRLEARFGPLALFSSETWNPGGQSHRGQQTALEGMSVFDAAFIYSPSFVWVMHRSDDYERNWQRWVVRSVVQAQYARGADRRVIGTVMPSYDDRVERKKRGFEIPPTGPRGNTYDLTWKLAVGESSDLVLVSTWNEFFEGSAIEPTVEHGADYLQRTREWSSRLQLATRPKKRGLVLTGEASAHFAPGIADPHVDGRYARNLQLVAERELPDYAFEAIDVESPALQTKDLSRYALVLVEPGLAGSSRALASLMPRLSAWVSAGGRLLVSAAPRTSALRGLTGASGDVATTAATHVTTNDGLQLSIPPAGDARREEPGDGAATVLRYSQGEGAAAWRRHLGSGEIVAVGFHVAGRDPYPGSDATATFCASVRSLLAEGEHCENTHSDTIP